ncbi:hypothetical protein HU200_015743 [Digitaria exilis]|uniref:glucan endo-1,3-beta-D-glucosidase n=1 Tax=Digitaria exilis TaxID=1010633 RepID=A0A835F9A6_9POAL|nr:hypothetical protein HU200_015743 [Digitaria exilis]CAB3456153.1 unnamed protein product [Digitaria exilis]
MAPPSSRQGHAAAALSVMLLLIAPSATAAIGVNYGTKGDNLPPPSKVASFLANHTLIDRVKLFDTNADMVRAFAGTGISLTVTVANGDIPSLATNSAAAAAWVAANVSPYYPSTSISLVAVGNEITNTGDDSLISSLVPAMRALKSALAAAGLDKIRVTTPHSLGILAGAALGSSPASPSASRFVPGLDRDVFAPMLEFHRSTSSPFMVNPYPYFGYNGDTVAYALARRGSGSSNPGVRDPGTGITYTSMFEAQLDSVYSAMKRLGFGDVEIAVGETGWPSKAEDGQVGVSAAEAAEYNRYIIGEATAGLGTPLMPRRKFETYIFALFNENLKPGPVAERNFGLFEADLTPVYDVGLMKDGTGKTAAAPPPAVATTSSGEEAAAPEPAVEARAKKQDEEEAAAPAETTTASSGPAPSVTEEDDASPDATGSSPSEAPAAEGDSTTGGDKAPEEEGGDAPAAAAGGESSDDAAAKDGDGEGSTEEKKPETTPAPAGSASAAADLLVPISSMLAAALSLALHM